MHSNVLGPLLLLVCVALAVKGLVGKDRGQVGYRRGRFLSENGKAFPEWLDRVVGPDHRVFAQVRLAALVDVEAGGSSGARSRTPRQVLGKRVDFGICNRSTLDPVMAIEVDDRSHHAPARRQRDAFVDELFAHGGLTSEFRASESAAMGPRGVGYAGRLRP